MFVPDVKVAVKNKVPLVRSLTLNWVTFCIETSNKATVLKLHKEYVPICMEVNEPSSIRHIIQHLLFLGARSCCLSSNSFLLVAFLTILTVLE